MKIVLASLALAIAAPLAAHPFGEEDIVFEARSGETVAALRGTFEVKENRADPASRTITLSYVRFPATTDTPGPPIVYLAGGPGGSGSGTATGDRFPLFMAMREHGDVIAFDQRGTGGSTPLPQCTSSIVPSQTQPLGDPEYAGLYRAAAQECRAFWEAGGIDIRGYTTRESVHDLSALRKHLGADRIVLWGISYGTHLAMAALDTIPGEIDSAILASAEGLDQTVKLPARTDAYFARLQAAVDAQPEARALFPDIAAMIRRVHARLETDPVLIELQPRQGPAFPFLLQRRHVQEFASGLIADPGNAAAMLELYRSLDKGDTDFAARLFGTFVAAEEPIALSAMTIAMDVASGISDARMTLFESQRSDALLGSALNFPMPHLRGVWPDVELGDDFRDGPVGDTPILLLSGTLDGRTYPESQREALAGMRDVTAITVAGAGHNLFMTSPEVEQAMHRFLRKEDAEVTTISVEVADLTALPAWMGG